MKPRYAIAMDEPNLDEIEMTIRRSPSLMRQLSSFALDRRGWGDTDGGFGVTYSTDLDDHDRDIENVNIPDGCVQLYGHWGPRDGYEIVIAETTYIQHLARVLNTDGIPFDSAALKSLRNRLLDDDE